MLKQFYPSECVDSTYLINFEKLYKDGFRGLLFDIDNTLVPHGAKADQRAISLFERLKTMGFHICLISNNKEPRVKMFNEDVRVSYIFKAGKPSVKAYQAAMEKTGTSKENTVFIGDQIFTDIFGANRAGLKNYLVKPMDPREEIQIVLKRYLERVVLFFYQRSKNKK